MHSTIREVVSVELRSLKSFDSVSTYEPDISALEEFLSCFTAGAAKSMYGTRSLRLREYSCTSNALPLALSDGLKLMRFSSSPPRNFTLRGYESKPVTAHRLLSTGTHY
ncbi:hypothetical protein C8Q79DRAFT_30147 [Trametes meyenii]|nr:hypothetical protein C8Q79DRAFT_30147 [Trametes meyenii]